MNHLLKVQEILFVILQDISLKYKKGRTIGFVPLKYKYKYYYNSIRWLLLDGSCLFVKCFLNQICQDIILQKVPLDSKKPLMIKFFNGFFVCVIFDFTRWLFIVKNKFTKFFTIPWLIYKNFEHFYK